MPSTFELATAVRHTDDHTYALDVPDGWQQGRGAFGGLVLGAIARAMIASEPDAGRALRMLAGEICGPVLPLPSRVTVEVLRRGNNLTNLDARLVQEGAVLARASAGLSTARSTGGAVLAPPPSAPPRWQDAEIVEVPRAFAPAFARHFAYRPTGPLPFSGGTEPIVEGYVRERETPTRVDAPTIIALLDAYWPTIFSIESRPRGAATVGFTAQILTDPGALDPEVPLFHRARLVAMRDGFFVEMRELWHETTLVAMNQQTFALLS